MNLFVWLLQIISNTTVQRPDPVNRNPVAKESGGLSGKPLFDLSTEVLKEMYARTKVSNYCSSYLVFGNYPSLFSMVRQRLFLFSFPPPPQFQLMFKDWYCLRFSAILHAAATIWLCILKFMVPDFSPFKITIFGKV